MAGQNGGSQKKKSKVTMTDVAKLAGVSQSTVSIVLGNKKTSSIPEATVFRVLSAANQLNYSYRFGKSASGSKEHKILVTATNLNNSYYTTMIHAIEMAAYDTEFDIVIRNTYHDRKREEAIMMDALRQEYDGVLFLYPPDDRELFHTIAKSMPAIAICDRESQMNTDIVELNNMQSGELLAEHLLKLGHREIGFLTTPYEGHITRTMRLKGVQNAMQKEGLSEHLHIIVTDEEQRQTVASLLVPYNEGYVLAQRKEIRDKKITALICINDIMAVGVMDYLEEHNIRVPEDISVAGIDNLSLSGLRQIDLTTIDNHMDSVAQSAIGLLFTRIRSKKADQDMEVPAAGGRFKAEFEPDLIVRGTTGPVPGRTHGR